MFPESSRYSGTRGTARQEHWDEVFARVGSHPVANGSWLSDRFDSQALVNENVEIGREHSMVRADLPAKARVPGTPPLGEVALARRPATWSVITPARKARVEDRKYERFAWLEQLNDVRCRGTEIAYVRETEVAGDYLEALAVEARRRAVRHRAYRRCHGALLGRANIHRCRLGSCGSS